MKIGILTFVEADNYGAMCQAYALQRVINEKYGECELIRYRNRSLWIQFHNCKFSESRSIFSFIKRRIEIESQKRRRKAFEIFRNRLLISNVCNRDQLINRSSEYKKIIVGSDQVWNPKNTAGDITFLLDFCSDDKKIAYAASFGNPVYFEQFGSEAGKFLSLFDSISVREASGNAFLKERFSIDSSIVLDPVLLLNREEWGSLVQPMDGDYIFVYQLKSDPKFVDAVNRFAKHMQLKVIVLPYLARCYLQNLKYRKIKRIYSIGPDLFLSYIYNATYILTDSFHGVALSIAMNKQFYVKMDDKTINTNERIQNILDITDLNNRRFDNMFDGECIDYSSVNERIKKQQQESYNFLQKAIED